MPFDPERTCSALHRDVPMLGTAPHKTAYVVLDVKKPWPRKVHQAKDCPEDLKESLPEDAVLVATPALTEKRWVRVFRRKGDETVCHRFPYTAEALRRSLSGPPQGVMPDPLLLICTHGTRDACCARLGVPLLHHPSEGRTRLEVSHLGGHRFAPVLLALPEWRFFGKVTADIFPEFLQRLENGHPDPEHYRGCGLLPPEVQVLEGAIWERTGRPPRCLGWQSGSRPEFITPDGTYQAEVSCQTYRGYGSCRDFPGDSKKSLKRYRLESLAFSANEREQPPAAAH